MKLFKNLLLVCVLFLGFTAAHAQSKLAHINIQELLAAMPETKQMEEKVQKAAQAFDADYQSQTVALKVKLQKYDQEAATQTDAENQKRALEVEELKSELQIFAGKAQSKIQEMQYDLYIPIVEKSTNAIKSVAAAKGFDYVLDSSADKGVIVVKGEDLMIAVKLKLGI